MASSGTTFARIRTRDSARLLHAGTQIARAGLVFCFLFIGLAKFTPEEARGIQPLVSHSPLMSWMYSLWSIQTVSDIIGSTELVIMALLVVGIWSARVSVAGAIGAVLIFLATICFLFSTPGAIVLGHGFPALSGTGQFLIKDVVLLGASVALVAEGLERLNTTK
jgi:reactive chlorine resistance protein C